MSKNNVRIWIIISIFLAIGVAPFLAQGDQETRQRIEQNRQIIATMTQSERDSLERNFAAYQKKTPQELATIQGFHHAIEENRSQSSGEYSKALDQYDLWLATIEPFQRDELKEISDPLERIRRMSEILREQRSREASSVVRRRFQNSPLANVPVLNKEQLQTLMDGVEDLEKDRLSDQQESELNRLGGIARFLKMLQMLKENTQLRPQDRSQIPPWVVKELFVTLRKIESQHSRYIRDETVRNYLLEETNGSREISTILRIQAVILKSLLIQVLGEQGRNSSPAQHQLEELFASLPEEEQDALLQLEAIEFYKELVVRSEPATPNEENRVSFHDVFEVFKPSREDQMRRPPGKGPPGDRDGRPGNGQDGRKRDDFRGDRRGTDGRPPPRDDREDRNKERPPN
ncbi:hypothetical protein OAH05_01705 [bacterium]|jgi:hypothetical protein|nr:hypothetical protein [Planctomicrobium sp.]MDB4802621.1 hypothetical protein [bacterium]